MMAERTRLASISLSDLRRDDQETLACTREQHDTNQVDRTWCGLPERRLLLLIWNCPMQNDNPLQHTLLRAICVRVPNANKL
jgi:hypothetical protein